MGAPGLLTSPGKQGNIQEKMDAETKLRVDIARAFLAVHSTLLVVVNGLPVEARGAVYPPLEELMNRIGELIARLDTPKGDE